MKKGYLKGLNFIIEVDTYEPNIIPIRAARWQPRNEELFIITDHETNESFNLALGEVFDENDAPIAGFQDTCDYLSSIIGGFKTASGSSGAVTTNRLISEVCYEAPSNGSGIIDEDYLGAGIRNSPANGVNSGEQLGSFTINSTTELTITHTAFGLSLIHI